jgi:hypothetical protein
MTSMKMINILQQRYNGCHPSDLTQTACRKLSVQLFLADCCYYWDRATRVVI